MMQGGQVLSIIIFCQSWIPIQCTAHFPSKTMVQDLAPTLPPNFQRIWQDATLYLSQLCLDYLENFIFNVIFIVSWPLRHDHPCNLQTWVCMSKWFQALSLCVSFSCAHLPYKKLIRPTHFEFSIKHQPTRGIISNYLSPGRMCHLPSFPMFFVAWDLVKHTQV